MPFSIASAMSVLERLPLNESGATTIFKPSPHPIPEFPENHPMIRSRGINKEFAQFIIISIGIIYTPFLWEPNAPLSREY